MSLFKNISVVSLHVKDWEGAKKFYRELLGWPILYSNDEMGWEEYGEGTSGHVAISRWDDPATMPKPSKSTVLVLTVEDVFKTTDELRARGVKCEDAKVIPGVVAYGTFYDPEGNCIQFAAETPPPA
jgi:predicted enzyme related to lactoylglutathione lyase